jgi:hypothetical protein
MHGIHLGVKGTLLVANSCSLAIAIVEDDVIMVVMHPRGLIRGHLMHYPLPAAPFGTLSGQCCVVYLAGEVPLGSANT